jgi:hypothetical protein
VLPPCEAVLPLVTLEAALQVKVVGKTAFIVNLPDPKIGMQARINCRYGLTTPAKKGDDPVPKVEVSVSGYDTADSAAARVAATVAAWRNNGATSSDVTIDSDQGTLLTGYGSPLLVVQHDRLTVAITVTAALLKGHSPTAVMAQVAVQAIRGAS